MERPLIERAGRFVSLALLLAAMCGVANADSTSTDDALARLVDDLGTPARASAVEKWTRRAQRSDRETRARVIQAVGRCGGEAAARGLATLSPRVEPELQGLFLEAVRAIDLRAEGLPAAALRAFSSPDPMVRRQAVHLLGRIGDGRHVPFLVEQLGRKDATLRLDAYLALRTRSGP